jgi:hypothetical protein
MAQNDEETADAQEGNEDKTSDENNDENEEQDLEKKLKEYKAQKEHYKGKVEKLESALEDSDGEDDTSSDNITRQSSGGQDGDKLERIELKVEGYDDEEIDFIMRNGGKDAVDDPYVQNAIEGIREEKEAEEASEAASDSGGGGEVVKGYTQEDLQDMSREELEEILPKSS